jgi:sodium/hydrogen exchanger-like protein 6/7
MMINAVCRVLGKPDTLPRNHQMMLFWAGLRGAVAFALASGITGDSAPAMRTTILAVVVLTVLLFGGTTSRMLQILDVKTGVIEPNDSASENEEEDEDDEGNSQRSKHGKKYSKLNSNDPSEERLLESVDDDPLLETGQRHQRRRKGRTQDYSDISIGGLLSGPLGEPIPEDRPPHWFVSFDEKWIKPFLTKKHIQQKNQTLAEYWREKRRKMERANRNMLDGIRGINVDDEEFDNSDALTLNSVKSTSRLNRTTTNSSSSNAGFPRPNLHGGPSSSKIVIGSGRVFGRSPSIDDDDEDNM